MDDPSQCCINIWGSIFLNGISVNIILKILVKAQYTTEMNEQTFSTGAPLYFNPSICTVPCTNMPLTCGMKLKLRTYQGWGQVKYLYLVQNIEYLVLTCTWHFEIQNYLVLTCTWMQSTWYLSKYFQVLLSNYHVYTGLNLEYVFFNKSPLNTILLNYWNGSYCVFTAWVLQTSRLDCLPWSAGQKYIKSLTHGKWGCNLKVLILKFISTWQG